MSPASAPSRTPTRYVFSPLGLCTKPPPVSLPFAYQDFSLKLAKAPGAREFSERLPLCPSCPSCPSFNDRSTPEVQCLNKLADARRPINKLPRHTTRNQGRIPCDLESEDCYLAVDQTSPQPCRCPLLRRVLTVISTSTLQHWRTSGLSAIDLLDLDLGFARQHHPSKLLARISIDATSSYLP